MAVEAPPAFLSGLGQLEAIARAILLLEVIGNLGLYSLHEQSTRPDVQDLGEAMAESSWLTQLDTVMVGHGVLRFVDLGFRRGPCGRYD